MVGGTAQSSTTQNGYILDYIMTDTGATAECSFDYSVSNQSNGEDFYVELVSSVGTASRMKANDVKTMPCIYMTGGSVRLVEKRFPKADKEIMQVALPYVNGGNVSMYISKDPTFVEEVFSPVELFRTFSSSLF